MTYGYQQYGNPYMRNYPTQSYMQPQYAPQPQQVPQQPQMVQPQQQPMQYEMPIQYVGNGTIKEAEAYILFPNQKAIFIDKGNDMVYEKVCGVDGQSAITAYEKVNGKNEKQAVESPKAMPTIDLSNYVQKGELGAFVSLKQYNELLAKVENLQKAVVMPTTKQ